MSALSLRDGRAATEPFAYQGAVMETKTETKTGDTCPQSGIWSSACCDNRISMTKGERFPPCRGCHKAADWEIVDATSQ